MKWVFLFIAIVCVGGIVVFNWYYGSQLDGEAKGLFGDQFGMSNAIFSGLAFTGVLFAILQQRDEIKIAKEELSRTKEMLVQQKESLDLQNEETKFQIFENTFFQLLNFLQDITNQIDFHRQVNGSTVVTSGKDVFPILNSRLDGCFLRVQLNLSEEDIFVKGYDDFYNSNGGELTHYFSVIRNLIEFVDQSAIEKKEFYIRFVRDQFSNDEVSLLFHHGMSSYGQKLKPLLEKYAFLENLNGQKIRLQSLKKNYDFRAYGENAEARSIQ
ncbi:putative phage abortive infection protein [Paremcibacter congregatus]|uniref:putative phage abortive infection protein n=1 Tax=Paremcibacter congregatus TaxID=2043170 RepID=UPI003A93D1E7